MNSHHLPAHHRVALAIGAAVLTLAASHASAQSFGQNLFAGPDTAPSNSVSTTDALLSIGTSKTGLVGPGYSATVMLGAGALDTLTESIDAGGFGTLTALESGVGNPLPGPTFGLGLGGTFSATKALPERFTPNQTYVFTLNTTNNAALNLLTGANITLSTVDGGTTTVVGSLSSGSGLLGIAQVDNLFAGGNMASFLFTAPANVDTSVPITFTVSGALAVGAINNTFTFTSATLALVPEPGTSGAVGIGTAALLLVLRRPRRGVHFLA